MLILGAQSLGVQIGIGAITVATPGIWVRWQLYWYHRSGGLKKIINVGQENSFISGFSFEVNEFGCGAGTINLGYIDFPIDADDMVKIYFKGNIKYTGIVEVTPDIKGGEIQLIPLWNRIKERLVTTSYSTKTVFQILKDVFTVQVTDTGILWADANIVTDSSATYTVSYSYATIEKVINDMIGKLTDKYYGVDANGFFYVKSLDSAVSSQLYYTDSPAYSDIEIETDTSGIKATRYQVYIKQTGTGTTGNLRVGKVGYGTTESNGKTYAILPVENLFRIKEDKLTVPDGVTSSDALDYAYALLQSYQYLTPITVNNVELDKYEPEIGKLITVQDRDEEVLNTILVCDSITGWTNATIDNTYYIEGSGSVKFTCAAIGNYMEYSWSKQIYLKEPQRIGFMIRSSAASGIFLSVKIYSNYTSIPNSYGNGVYGVGAWGEGDGTGDGEIEYILTNTINIGSVALWYYYDFPLTTPIIRIRFECTSAPSGSTTINVDRIQCFQNYQSTYSQNIVQVNYDIIPENENVTMKLNTYDRSANLQLKEFETKINTINSVITN